MGREDPVRHGDALGLEQLSCGLILGRVPFGSIIEVARVEVVGLPRNELSAHAHRRPVVAGHHLRRGVKERLANVGRQLRQAVHVLRSLQRERWHVIGKADLQDGCRVPATNEAGLVLRTPGLVADATGLLCPCLCILARERGHDGRLRVVALLCRVARRHRHPAAALGTELAAQGLDIVVIRAFAASELREFGCVGRLLREGGVQLLHRIADALRRPAVRIDALTWAVALHDQRRHLVLDDVQDPTRGLLWDVQVPEGLVRSDLPFAHERVREEVIHGLGVGGRGALNRRLPQSEIFRRTVAHLLPRVRQDHRLAELGVGSEGDFARRHKLGWHVVQARARHPSHIASLVGDGATVIRVAMQPARMEHHFGVCGSLEGGRRVTFSAHHQLGKGVAPVAF
mmetsp:Transcript_99950/g.214054  ORF Transcript_99950/g.214054 Transcript_99950/m.214054 type:complete len:400 (+) Transcript_99950:1546-2745(+)